MYLSCQHRSCVASLWFISRLFVLALFFVISACTKLGPDFVKPDAPGKDRWLQADDAMLSVDRGEPGRWWQVFNDPVLDGLIESAYGQNLTLQVAGLRILEARANLGIAVGQQFPQRQQASGSISTIGISEHSPNFTPAAEDRFSAYQVGFDAAWELDFWGRFRRGIEAADADLQASLADYEDVLVSLVAEVARVYVVIRTLEERIDLALNNIELQRESLRIADVRFKHGATSELDVQQAKSNLASTQALVPVLRGSLRQARNALSVLLGVVPGELASLFSVTGTIPVAPPELTVGIPADLLRRRPDVRRAESIAASQSALIGVAKADFYPSFSLLGSIGLQSSDTGKSDAGDLLNSDSLVFSAGPTFQWNILNYGRIKNRIRVQDARYQQAIVNYRDTVLRAYQEMEDAMVGFLQSRKEAGFREQSARAAQRSSEIAHIQYREGAVDFQRVIDSERVMVDQQDRWTTSRGDIALNLIAMYKALGGGWEVQEGGDTVSKENRDAMRKRTDWGKLLSPDGGEVK